MICNLPFIIEYIMNLFVVFKGLRTTIQLAVRNINTPGILAITLKKVQRMKGALMSVYV